MKNKKINGLYGGGYIEISLSSHVNLYQHNFDIVEWYPCHRRLISK